MERTKQNEWDLGTRGYAALKQKLMSVPASMRSSSNTIHCTLKPAQQILISREMNSPLEQLDRRWTQEEVASLFRTVCSRATHMRKLHLHISKQLSMRLRLHR